MREFLRNDFLNDPSATEICTLSLHDALPIWRQGRQPRHAHGDRLLRLRAPLPSLLLDLRLGFARAAREFVDDLQDQVRDRKSTRLNSSHANISYAVFCLKKKLTIPTTKPLPI